MVYSMTAITEYKRSFQFAGSLIISRIHTQNRTFFGVAMDNRRGMDDPLLLWSAPQQKIPPENPRQVQRPKIIYADLLQTQWILRALLLLACVGGPTALRSGALDSITSALGGVADRVGQSGGGVSHSLSNTANYISVSRRVILCGLHDLSHTSTTNSVRDAANSLA